MYGHKVARQLEEWHLKHNGQHNDEEWRAYLEDFQALVATKAGEMLEEHDNAGKFGLSKAGGCTRSAALKKLGAEGTPFSGSTRMTFFIGHVVECMAIASLRAIGLDVQGTQLSLDTEFFHSATDGVITEFEGQPTMLSVKSAGYKKSGRERRGVNWTFVRRGFPELPFQGVLRSQPGHYAQMQGEMYAHGTKQSLYLVVAKDIIKAMEEDPYLGEGTPENPGNGSLTFYAELVPYNEDFVFNQLLPTWEGQWENVKRGQAGKAHYLNVNGIFGELKPASLGREPNAAVTGTFNPCDYCDLVAACKENLLQTFKRR